MKTVIPAALCATCLGVQLAGNRVDGFVSVVTAGESKTTTGLSTSRRRQPLACASCARVDGVGHVLSLSLSLSLSSPTANEDRTHAVGANAAVFAVLSLGSFLCLRRIASPLSKATTYIHAYQRTTRGLARSTDEIVPKRGHAGQDLPREVCNTRGRPRPSTSIAVSVVQEL